MPVLTDKHEEAAGSAGRSSRGSVFRVFNRLIGVAALPASLVAGWLWRHYSAPARFFISALLSFSAAILLWLA